MEEHKVSETNTLRLSNDAIAMIQQLLTMSLLTKTNVLRQLQTLTLKDRDGLLEPTTECVESTKRYVSVLIAKAEDELERAQNVVNSENGL